MAPEWFRLSNYYLVLISLGIPWLAVWINNTVVTTLPCLNARWIAFYTWNNFTWWKSNNRSFCLSIIFLSVTRVDSFVVGSKHSAIRVHPWRNDVISCTLVNSEYSIHCIYPSYSFSVFFHDFIINESNDLLSVVQSRGRGALQSKQNAFIVGSNCCVHARHNSVSLYSFIRQYFCLSSYVNPMVTQTFVVRISGCLLHN